MLQEPPKLVAMRLALGQQLAALREAARIIQPQIARKTGYSRSSVAHAEAGRQLLTREFRQTADELLQADGALLTSYEQVRAAKEEHEAKSREAQLPGASRAGPMMFFSRSVLLSGLLRPTPDRSAFVLQRVGGVSMRR